MKMNKILCPTDFSDFSRATLDMAATLARESGAELILMHCVDLATTYTDELYYDVGEDLKPELQRTLDELAVPEPAPRVRRLLVEGDAGAAILDVARDEKVDMIVLATHGRTGLTRLLLGSVAEYVIRHATCPVLTLKTAAAVPAAA
jgi:nucleotide-binding universal stress UspA family protein